jgi:hypothetical protein
MTTPTSHQERWATQENARRTAAYQRAQDAWQADDDELARMVEAARTYAGSPTPPVGSPVVLRRGERAFTWVPTARLIEVQRAPGTYAGGYSGFSFRVAKGIRFSVGGSKGTYVPGPEQMKITDVGSATVTNQRIVFTGSRNSREWAYAKLISVEHDPARPITMIGVSNRQKVSGIAHSAEASAAFRFNLGLALAHARDDLPAFVAALEAERAEHAGNRPVPPVTVTAADAPTGARRARMILSRAVVGKPGWPRWLRATHAVAVAFLLLIVLVGGIGAAVDPQPASHDSAASAQPTTQAAQTTTPPATAPAATTTRPAPAVTHTRAAPRHTAAPLTTHRPRPTVHAVIPAPTHTRQAPPPAPSTTVTVQHACTQTSSGSCIRGGEFCPNADDGQYGYDAQGRRYICRDRHWEKS